jgi:hypothetical protein
VLKEIRKTKYVPKCVSIGSRDKLCINKDIIGEGDNQLSGAALRLACKNSNNVKGCEYNCKKNDALRIPQDSLDIEELFELSE